MIWQGQQDLNPHKKFWRLLCYRYIIPLLLLCYYLEFGGSTRNRTRIFGVGGRHVSPLHHTPVWWLVRVTLPTLRLFRPTLSLDQLSSRVYSFERHNTLVSAAGYAPLVNRQASVKSVIKFMERFCMLRKLARSFAQPDISERLAGSSSFLKFGGSPEI